MSDLSAPRSRSEALLKRVLDHLEPARKTAFGAILIAVDGRSGVGKSALSQPLAERLGATLVHGDDFFAGGTQLLSLDDAALADICIDRARLSAVLAMLKSGRKAVYRAFDWHAFNGSLNSNETSLTARPVIVVEGVYTVHPDLRNLVDISVVIEVSNTERERRLVKREGQLGAWERQWHRAEEWYFAHLAPPTVFDIRFDNN